MDDPPILAERVRGLAAWEWATIAVALHTKLSPRRVAKLLASEGWSIRKCGWTDYEIVGPFAELVIEAEAPILLRGPIADPEANVDRILALLRRAGVAYEGECYDAGGALLREFRWENP